MFWRCGNGLSLLDHVSRLLLSFTHSPTIGKLLLLGLHDEAAVLLLLLCPTISKEWLLCGDTGILRILQLSQHVHVNWQLMRRLQQL